MRGYVGVFLLFRRPSSQECPAKGDGGYWLVRILPCQRGRGLLARIHPPLQFEPTFGSALLYSPEPWKYD